MEDSIRKRLSLQKEVLNWLNKFSENLQNRANVVTLEVHQLLDQTDIVEQDMKNTLNSFRNLSHTRFVENKISEDELSDFRKEEGTNKRRAQVSIPAQSYETDILPRYKEAVSLGLSSYHSYMQKTDRTSSTGSVFKTGSGCNPLPHIIGSAEYIHDNTCGLTEEFSLDILPRDFSHLAKPKEGSADAGMFGSDTIFSDLLGEQQSPSEKSGIEPMVSAASDFKAMLEAALLSPYKLYHDEGNSSLSDTVHDYNSTTVHVRAELDHVSYALSDNDEVASPQHQTGISENTVPITSANLSSLQNFDAQIDKIPSALISESLFDAEEESLLSSIHETCEALSTINISVHNSSEIAVDVIDKEDIMHDSLFGDDDNDDANVKDIAPQSASLSSPNDGNIVEGSAVTFDESDRLATHVPEDDRSASVCKLPSQDGDGYGDHSEITDDPGSHLKEYSEKGISSVQTAGGSLDGDDLSSCEG